MPSVTILENAGWHTLPCGRKHKLVKCRCRCGKLFIAQKRRISDGTTKSCGCYRSERLRQRNKQSATHGLSSHPLYHTWYEMHKRCSDPQSTNWKNYGERGIKVCDAWFDIEVFIHDVSKYGDRPKNFELDRIDNNGNYCSENCRWASVKSQARNRRSNVHLLIDGETKCIAEWSEVLGIPETSLRRRYNKGARTAQALKESKCR